MADNNRTTTWPLKRQPLQKHRPEHKPKKRKGCAQNKRKKRRRREMKTKREGSSNRRRKRDRGRSTNARNRSA